MISAQRADIVFIVVEVLVEVVVEVLILEVFAGSAYSKKLRVLEPDKASGVTKSITLRTKMETESLHA
jgi:hypothetical protein